MKILYLTETNLKDRLFIKDLVHNFKFSDKAILLHEPFGGTLSDSRFVSKRISSLLSDQGVYNNVFSAEVRNYVEKKAGEVHIATEKLQQLLQVAQLVILSPVYKVEGELQLADPIEMVQAMRYVFGVDEIIVFTDNPLSPLGGKLAKIETSDDIEPLLSVYEEERPCLDLALKLRPARVLSPAKLGELT